MSEYRDIPGFPCYSISATGVVFSKKRGRPLKPAINFGYSRVFLSVGGKIYRRAVHRLVLETFVGPCPPGMECCHADGNPQNNEIDNLRWATPKENEADKVRHGRRLLGSRSMLGTIKERARGEQVAGAKLSVADVREIRHRYDSGESKHALAAEFGIHERTVRKIAKRQKWKHVS